MCAMNPRLLRPLATSKGVPRTIANLVLWLDADDSSTVSEVSGGVSEWRDKSAVKRAYTQSDQNNRPIVAANAIGTRRAIRFQGGNDVLASNTPANDLVSPMTMWIVGAKSTNAADGGLFTLYKAGEASFNSDDLWCVSSNSFGALFRTFGGAGGDWAPSVGNSATVAGSFVWRCQIVNNSNNTTVRNLVGGANSTDLSYTFAATPSNDGSAIGVISNAGTAWIHYLTGDIAEIIAYSRALDATEQQTIQSYIATKYGLTLT
jgi:hypothetical protein